MVLAVVMFMFMAFYVPNRAYEVINVDKKCIVCQNQNFAQVVTNWIVEDLLGAVQRNCNLVQAGIAVANFSGTQIDGTLPALYMGLMSSDMPFVGSDGSIFAVWRATGNVFSAEVISTNQPVGKLYRNDTGLCYEASYSAISGFGAFAPSSTGPLGAACINITSAAWYTSAQAMSGGAKSTTTGPTSSGYIGITYMVHDTTSNAVFGGEMDGRTLSALLNPGKAVEGEIYVVSTTDSVETLLATTETSAQASLASNVTVDATTVGGLTGSSASELQSTLSSFSQLWSRSASVSMAESYGQVAEHCPSSTTAAYIAVAAEDEYMSSRESISLQRFNSTGQLQLLLVSALPKDLYSTFIFPCTCTTIALGFFFHCAGMQHSGFSSPDSCGATYKIVCVLLLDYFRWYSVRAMAHFTHHTPQISSRGFVFANDNSNERDVQVVTLKY
jgi:hypothetical protein